MKYSGFLQKHVNVELNDTFNLELTNQDEIENGKYTIHTIECLDTS